MDGRHVHRYCWGGSEWLKQWGGKSKGKQPPEPRDYCRCGERNPKATYHTPVTATMSRCL